MATTGWPGPACDPGTIIKNLLITVCPQVAGGCTHGNLPDTPHSAAWTNKNTGVIITTIGVSDLRSFDWGTRPRRLAVSGVFFRCGDVSDSINALIDAGHA